MTSLSEITKKLPLDLTKYELKFLENNLLPHMSNPSLSSSRRTNIILDLEICSIFLNSNFPSDVLIEISKYLDREYYILLVQKMENYFFTNIEFNWIIDRDEENKVPFGPDRIYTSFKIAVDKRDSPLIFNNYYFGKIDNDFVILDFLTKKEKYTVDVTRDYVERSENYYLYGDNSNDLWPDEPVIKVQSQIMHIPVIKKISKEFLPVISFFKEVLKKSKDIENKKIQTNNQDDSSEDSSDESSVGSDESSDDESTDLDFTLRYDNIDEDDNIDENDYNEDDDNDDYYYRARFNGGYKFPYPTFYMECRRSNYNLYYKSIFHLYNINYLLLDEYYRFNEESFFENDENGKNIFHLLIDHTWVSIKKEDI